MNFKEDIKVFKKRMGYESMRFFSLFQKELKPFIKQGAEFSISPDFNSFGIMIKSKDSLVSKKIISFLCQSGLEYEKINAFEKIYKHFPDTGILFKVDFSKGKLKYSLYYQFLISISSIGEFSKELGISFSDCDSLKKVMSILKKNGFYMGMEFETGEKTCINFIFQKLNFNNFQEKIKNIMKLLSLKEEVYLKFKKHFQAIAGGNAGSVISNSPVYISFSSKEKLLRGLKVDFENPAKNSILKIFKNEGIDSSKINLLDQIFSKLNINNATYLGIKYSDSPEKFKLYFNREYEKSNLDILTVFAKGLKDTIWLP